MRYLALASIVILVGALNCGSAGPQPATAPSTGFFIFVLNQPKDARLYRVNRDGTGERRLTTAFAGRMFDPTVSPDGQYVVYSTYDGTQQKLWRVNVDGTGQKCLTPDDASECTASIHPDGRRMVFHSDRNAGRGCRLWTMNVDGTGRKELTSKPMLVESNASYSPDGSEIVFTGISESGSLSLYVHDVATGRRTMLAAPPAKDTYWDTSNFSPDGLKLVVSLCASEQDAAGSQAWYEMYVMDPDGSDQRLVGHKHGRGQCPQFTDGGRAVCYAMEEEGAIYVLDLTTEQAKRILQKPGQRLDEVTWWEPRPAPSPALPGKSKASGK
jgi:Tol biopolymer transport system component